MNFKVLHRLIQVFCVLITIVLSCLCFHKFFLDADLVQVNFQIFNDKEHAIYPTITLCFMGPYIFLEKKLKPLGEGISGRSYSNFLQGLTWNDEMRQIDFDNVTLNIEDYIEGVLISSSGDSAQLCSPNFQKILKHFSVPGCANTTDPSFSPDTFNFYISYRDYQTKCFSMDIPFEKGSKLNRLRIFVKSEVFPRVLDKQYMFEKNFGVFLHYPKQLFRSPIQKLYQKVENDSLLQVIKFKMLNMEVLIRRNKPNKQCNEDWNKDDDKILSKIIRAIGCQPPHWKIPHEYAMLDKFSNLDGCSDKSKMRLFSRHSPLAYLIPNIVFLNNLSPPCQDVTQILYEYTESEWNKEEFKGLDVQAKFFEVNFAFPSTVYKEIVQVRAYGIQSLVGYVGGYIGMFLGLGVLQLPSLLIKAIKKIKGSKSKTGLSGKRKNNTRRSKYITNFSMEAMNNSDNPQQLVECTPASNETNRKIESCELVINQVTDSILDNKIDNIIEKQFEENCAAYVSDTSMLQNRISNIEHKVEWLCDSMHKMRNKDLIVE